MPRLPKLLPAKPKFLWKFPLTGEGLAGVTATAKYVLVADRDLTDTQDVVRCVDAVSGKPLWQVQYPAVGGRLDYGNSPRAAPVIRDGRVYLLGAFGHLHCVQLADGEIVWKQDLQIDYLAKLPTWGFCSTPLVVDGKVIVNPGAETASLVALDAKTGDLLWATPGRAPGYGSFIAATFGGVKQIIGHDAKSLGGWDVKTGKRLWELIPPEKGDFNVPTPIVLGNKLLVATENNGTRLYDFDETGRIVRQPVALNEQLTPDTGTPVVCAGRVFGVWQDLFCLDPAKKLKAAWTGEDAAFARHVSLIAGKERLLASTTTGELLLLDATAEKLRIISRLKLFADERGLLSHPALVGTRLYIRTSSTLCCVELNR